MSEQFLILHKVRGKPAFDIAEQMEMGDEVWWIIPTSGHRAYPWSFWKLGDHFRQAYTPIPDDWRDHYEWQSQPSVKPEPRHREILARLGFKLKPQPTLRRL
jgi:hypothetical protein